MLDKFCDSFASESVQSLKILSGRSFRLARWLLKWTKFKRLANSDEEEKLKNHSQFWGIQFLIFIQIQPPNSQRWQSWRYENILGKFLSSLPALQQVCAFCKPKFSRESFSNSWNGKKSCLLENVTKFCFPVDFFSGKLLVKNEFAKGLSSFKQFNFKRRDRRGVSFWNMATVFLPFNGTSMNVSVVWLKIHLRISLQIDCEIQKWLRID